MSGVSGPNNTEPKGPKHLNMIEMAAPSITILRLLKNISRQNYFYLTSEIEEGEN